MRKAIQILALLVTLLLALAFQAPQPIPPYGGDDNPQHDGQPQWCQNNDTGGHLHNCSCKPSSMADPACQRPEGQEAEPGEEPWPEPARCSVFCRKDACRCKRDCGHTR